MSSDSRKAGFQRANDYLPRLDPACYRGNAYVHWSMTIDERRTGWLSETFHVRYREILTHTAFRYNLACPVYCCMPDHFHLLLIGYRPNSDQRIALKYLRRHVNRILTDFHCRLQQQAHDHVLSEEQRNHEVFETVAEYIARNPERAGLVPRDGFRSYPHTGCVLPGYPEMSLWQNDYWTRAWRILSFLRQGVDAKDGDD